MKNFLKILILYIGFLLLSSCASPTKLDVVLPNDTELNCSQLLEAFVETREFKKRAESYRDPGTGGNMTRTMLFWPALVKSMHNADEAMRAADHRAFHLLKIMRNKKCVETKELTAQMTKKSRPVYYSMEIKRLYKQYRRGIITEEEFILAKKKVLSQ
jgi:hypothetical protein